MDKKRFEQKVSDLINERINKLKNHIGKDHFKKDLINLEEEKAKDLEEIQKKITGFQTIHSQVKTHIKRLRELVPDITEQTVLCAVYLIYGKVLQTWEAIFLLSSKGYNFEIMELTRSISEDIDLIKVFYLDKNQKHLKKWFEGSIIDHKVARELEDEFIREAKLKVIEEHNLSPYDLATEVHSTYSKYTHCSYAAILDSVDVFNEDFDWNRYANTHYTLNNIHVLESAMTQLLLSLKMTYLELRDIENLEEIEGILTNFAGVLDENSLKNIIHKIR